DVDFVVLEYPGDVIIETNLSVNGGSVWQGWQTATNGGPVPGLATGMNLSDVTIQVRQTLTSDLPISPKLHGFCLMIEGERPAIPSVGSSLRVLPKNQTKSVTAKIKTSVDGVTYSAWQTVNMGQVISVPYPGFFKLTNYGGPIRYLNSKMPLEESITVCGEVIVA
ncbi:hypothetical protein H1S01_15560, partial [Heliobacterium chlorum]